MISQVKWSPQPGVQWWYYDIKSKRVDDLEYSLHSNYILETDRAAWHNGILLNQTFKELVGTVQFLKSCFKRSKPGTWGHLALPQHVFPNDGRGAGMEPYRCHNRAGGGCSLIGSQPRGEGDGYINAGNRQEWWQQQLGQYRFLGHKEWPAHNDINQGTIRFSDNMEDWPRGEMGVIGEGSVLHCWWGCLLIFSKRQNNGMGKHCARTS